MIENVTYSADTGQQYTLVSHAHERCVINNMASVCYTYKESQESRKCVGCMGSFLHLMKLDAHGGLGYM